MQRPTQEFKCDFSNPALVCGTSWGLIFQRFYKNGDFETMLKLTSPESIAKFGKENIRKRYMEMSFGYEMKLKSLTNAKTHYVLHYEAKILATTVVIRMQLTKGDVKIILPLNFLKTQYFLQ